MNCSLTHTDRFVLPSSPSCLKFLSNQRIQQAGPTLTPSLAPDHTDCRCCGSPGTAGSCKGFHSRWGSVKAGRNCNRGFPAGGQTVPRYEPWQRLMGWGTMLSGSLDTKTNKTRWDREDEEWSLWLVVSALSGNLTYDVQDVFKRSCLCFVAILTRKQVSLSPSHILLMLKCNN